MNQTHTIRAEPAPEISDLTGEPVVDQGDGVISDADDVVSMLRQVTVELRALRVVTAVGLDTEINPDVDEAEEAEA